MSILDELNRIRQELEAYDSVEVKVALFGTPGSGKSSLINALVGQHVAKIGVENDVTSAEQPYRWNGLSLRDLPGFDTEKFPIETYFERFKVEEYDILLCVFDNKLRTAELDFFKAVEQLDKPCLFVRNKWDTAWQPGKSQEELKQETVDNLVAQLGFAPQVYFTSCKTNEGVDELSSAIMDCLHDAKKERWLEGAQAHSEHFLELKHKLCMRLVHLYSGIAAANSVNPIPGVDVAVDVGVISDLFRRVRNTYGLSPDILSHYRQLGIPVVAQAMNNILNYATRDGIISLLKRFASEKVVEDAAKYAPVVGQIIAASLGFAIIQRAGRSFVNDCHTVAEAILQDELKYRS
jgi:predicted GTPase/uncharacterized protein (DUF697 family)